MNTKKLFKRLLSTTALMASLFTAQVYADYFPIISTSTYDAAGLADVQAKAAQGLECSYYGNNVVVEYLDYGLNKENTLPQTETIIVPIVNNSAGLN